MLHRIEHVNTFLPTFQVSHVLGNVLSVEPLDMLMHRLVKNGAIVMIIWVQAERRAVEIVRIIKKELTVLAAQVIWICNIFRSPQKIDYGANPLYRYIKIDF